MSSIASTGFLVPTGHSSKLNNTPSTNTSSVQGENSAGSIAPQSASTKNSGSNATTDFLNYMKKTPTQRLREEILKRLKLTEEDVAKMSPAQRAAIDKLIADEIKKSITGDTSNAPIKNSFNESGSALGQKLSNAVKEALLQLQQLDSQIDATTPTDLNVKLS